MTEHELALKLIEGDGRCFGLFTSCFWCPIRTVIHTYINCGKNQAERLEWAKEYIAKEEAK